MKLIRYEGENVTPSDDAILYRTFLSDGLFETVTPTFTSGAITIPAMRGVICGRDFTTDIEELTAVLASAGTITGQIYMWIDMADETYPLSIKIRNSVGSLSDDDINNGGQYYGLEIAQYTANTSAVTGVTLTVGLVEFNGLADKAPLSNPTFTGLITTAGQVAFPATQNPSSDPNTLDDYEEGTFTPNVTFVTTTGTITYTSQQGRYVKIGELVTVFWKCTFSQTGSNGFIKLGGLPFFVNGTQSATGSTYTSQLVSVTGIPIARADSSQNFAYLYQIINGDATPIGASNIVSVDIEFTMLYRA